MILLDWRNSSLGSRKFSRGKEGMKSFILLLPVVAVLMNPTIMVNEVMTKCEMQQQSIKFDILPQGEHGKCKERI
jgi:hypothetical protein